MTETPTETQKSRISKNPLIMGLFGGAIAYAMIFLAQTFIVTSQASVITVDIRKIVEMKRDELLTRYKGAYTAENAKAAEVELQELNDLIMEAAKKTSGGRPVFLKDIVLGNSIDKTKEVLEYIQNNQTEKSDGRQAHQ